MGAGRIALVALGAASFALAGWAGLGRMAIVPSMPYGAAGERHGALLITAIGLLIALERATVTRRRWAWGAPVFAAAATSGIALGLPVWLESTLALVAATLLVLIAARGAIATPRIAAGLMVVGALAWSASALLRAFDVDVARVTPYSMAFLVFTIVGERHELARALRPSRAATAAFAAIVVLYATGTVLTSVDLVTGTVVAGLALVGIAAWLLARDRPPAASRVNPLARFIARATRAGYLWLLFGGWLWTTFDGVPAGPRYDAMLHAVFAGFVLSLILAHAPIVLPAIVGGAFTFSPMLYLGAVVVSLATLSRVAGDLVGEVGLRNAGSVGIGVALLAFAPVMVLCLRPRRAASRAAVTAAGLR